MSNNCCWTTLFEVDIINKYEIWTTEKHNDLSFDTHANWTNSHTQTTPKQTHLQCDKNVSAQDQLAPVFPTWALTVLLLRKTLAKSCPYVLNLDVVCEDQYFWFVVIKKKEGLVQNMWMTTLTHFIKCGAAQRLLLNSKQTINPFVQACQAKGSISVVGSRLTWLLIHTYIHRVL